MAVIVQHIAVDVLCNIVSFSRFCELIHEFDLVDSLSPNPDESLTVFAPVNDAFEVLAGIQEFDFSSLTPKQSAYVLSYHVISTKTDPFTYANLECGSTTRTINGESTRTKCSDADEKFQTGPKQMDGKIPKIILPNINVCNGVIHAVDNVLLPNLDKMRDYWSPSTKETNKIRQ